MADARAEQIMVAVLAAVNALTTTGANAQRTRTYPYQTSELPALALYMGADVPLTELHNALIDWELVIVFEIYVQVITTLDTVINLVRKEIHNALLAAPTLGLGFVIDTIPGPASEPEIDAEGSKPVARQRLEFTVQYRTSRTDISAG